MKTGLVITTYNRPTYLEQCLESLIPACRSGVTVIVVDDATTDGLAIDLINDWSISAHIFWRPESRGIHNSIKTGFDILINEGCDTLINIDPDAIVKPDFITRLTDMLAKHPDKIITGFNTTTGGRHKPVSYFDGGVYKRTIGGINMCMTADIYRDIVRPSLTAKNWDWKVCEEMQRRNKYFVALTPSCVQHIGLVSSMGHYDGGVDVADDF